MSQSSPPGSTHAHECTSSSLVSIFVISKQITQNENLIAHFENNVIVGNPLKLPLLILLRNYRILTSK